MLFSILIIIVYYFSSKVWLDRHPRHIDPMLIHHTRKNAILWGVSVSER